ncbi:unnamed protein product [Choristocarpus tenellus]
MEAVAEESSSTQAHPVEVAKDAVASIFGSAACVYTGQPLDTIKVRMQARPDAFSGPFQCLRKTLAEEHITSLWKGSTPALCGAVMENMVAFGVNQQLKRLFPEEEGEGHTSRWRPVGFGAATGLFTSVVLCPSDVIKCKVQVNRSFKAGVGGEIGVDAVQMMKRVLRTQGIRGLFVGLGAQFARDVPFYAAFFGTYDGIVDVTKNYNGIPKEMLYLFAGGMAGVFGWAMAMPIDVAKSIIQTADVPKSLVQTMKDVQRTKGTKALFSGFSAALIRAFPANAALFLGYEVARRNL